MKRLLPFAGMTLILGACTAPDPNLAPTIAGPAGIVTRSEAIAIAEAYVKTAWRAQSRHQFHGKDSAHIEIHTPDSREGTGWWKVDDINFGVPYKWGGFDTPKSFLTGLKKGKYAGDISTPYKRRNLEAAVSRETVGIDCSGLVSRAWRLPRPYSTRELPGICNRLGSWSDLKPGDVLNCYNRHVLIFARWEQPGATFFAYEAGPQSGWRVTCNLARAGYLQTHGYVPLRYRNMVDDRSTTRATPTRHPVNESAADSMTIALIKPNRINPPGVRSRFGGKR